MNEDELPDDIPVIEPEIMGKREAPRSQAKRSTFHWGYAIGARLFCFLTWIVAGWFVVACLIGALLGFVYNALSTRSLQPKKALLEAYGQKILVGIVVMLGGVIGVFSPRIALKAVQGAWLLLGRGIKKNPFADLWGKGMGYFWK